MLCKGIVEKTEKCFVEIKLGRNKDKIGFQLERDEKTIKIKGHLKVPFYLDK
ncbi:hypothetical protein HMPREF0669_00745 (plasmid) [Prevotella sp. oral taxon 299 str. F0039]|jgi:hypothetical protein|nr:hypothetical protein HMPREF0669_00745 [Prevotella sp. oral taxon 299 str. F0039]